MNDELRQLLRDAGPVIRPPVLGKATAMKDGKVVAEVEFTEPTSVGEAIYRLSKAGQTV